MSTRHAYRWKSSVTSCRRALGEEPSPTLLFRPEISQSNHTHHRALHAVAETIANHARSAHHARNSSCMENPITSPIHEHLARHTSVNKLLHDDTSSQPPAKPLLPQIARCARYSGGTSRFTPGTKCIRIPSENHRSQTDNWQMHLVSHQEIRTLTYHTGKSPNSSHSPNLTRRA